MVETGMRTPATLIMTATISPSSMMPGSVHNDSDRRLNEYLEAFRFYLSTRDDLIDKIVLFENSDADLAPFHKIHSDLASRKAIYTVSLSSDYDATKGKGYGEFLMMDTGLDVLFRDESIENYTPIWKVTGRLKVANIEDLIATAPTNYDIYCDLRRVPLIKEIFGGNRWMELRIASFNLHAYRSLFYGKYESDFVLEKSFFEYTYKAFLSGADLKIFPRFKVQPKIIGLSGFSGVSYTSRQYLFKSGLRSAVRRLLPRLWL